MSIDLEALRQLAGDAQNLAVLAVTRADGTVHASLVSAGVIDRPPDGQPSIGVVVAGNAVKLRHLRRARRATAVFHAGYRWVAVEGGVAMAGPDDAGLVASEAVAELLRTVFVAAGGSHENWAEFDRVMATERRVAVFIAAERLTTNP